MTQASPPDLQAVLAQLKDFQRATAQYAFERMYGSSDPTRRFLVADEVGLGKTLVAKGIIALAVEKLWPTTKRIDVIYICSNSSIARQNINRLSVVPGADEVALASRITMLPVQIRDLASRKLNFVSFTPATSFDLRSNLGIMDERAVLFRMLEQAWGARGMAPQNALQGDVRTDRFRDLVASRYPASRIDANIAARFGEALAARVAAEGQAGGETIRQRWDQLCSFFARDAERSNRPGEALKLQNQVIGELRDLLATTCLKALEPDLIVLDEFQRFKHLLDEESEESRLARDLFNYSNDESEARVLLLSATPYKMFTGHDEAGGEDHYADFVSTIRFLQSDPGRTHRCGQILEDYRKQLLRSSPGDAAVLKELKSQLQAELRRVMVRTERLAVTRERDGMLRTIPADTLDVTPTEAVAFSGLGQIARHVEQGNPVEYWKSSPYLLSFMEEYELKKRVKKAVSHPDDGKVIGEIVRRCQGLGFPWEQYVSYSKIDPGNARMRWLFERFIESGAWRLLWIPPSRPWYRLEGPYAQERLQGFTKLLVFSSWNVVPKAVATMVSYAAEREMILSDDAAAKNTPESRAEFSPLLRFGKESGASLLALIYPSFALARMGAETERAEAAELPPLSDLLGELESRIRRALRDLPDPRDGRDDERWYWAAPALLDQREDREATLAWFEDPDVRRRQGMKGEEEENEAVNVFEDEHVPALREVVGQQGEKLGKRPADLCHVLAQLALGGPAVAASRALTNVHRGKLTRTDARMRGKASQVAYGLRNYFNLQEITSLIRGSGGELPYWRQVLWYCVQGGLGAVLEEYSHVLHDWLGVSAFVVDEAVEQIADTMIEALTIRTANPRVDEIVPLEGEGFAVHSGRRVRSRFAVRLSEEVIEGGKERTRTDQVRKAFNSPFWPFVLSTTSIGQEGLDFHLYCHAVAHWNLPSNPVDLEQREGRVHRFKGHAVRKNVAAVHGHVGRVPLGEDPWSAMFVDAVQSRGTGQNDLSPYWVYPLEGGACIERHVPILPLSREVDRFTRLRRAVTMYRMVFGQPRQEDLLEFLLNSMSEEEAARYADELRLDLNPNRIG